MKLALGTAQFGMNYGITNETGIVESAEVEKIIAAARLDNIDFIDTAVSYGDCESALGIAGMNNFKVVTKLPKLHEQERDISSWVREQTLDSIRRLRIKKLYGLLVHYSDDLLGARGEVLYRGLKRVKDEGLVSKIGVSIYSPKELNSIWLNFKLDLVQSPFNLIDRRLEESGWLHRLSEENVEIHVRSIFLQGLLLSKLGTLPPYFSNWQFLLNEWQDWLRKGSNNPVDACLNFVQSKPEINKIIVGVQSITELAEIVLASKVLRQKDWPDISSSDIMLIDPSNWET